MERKKADKKMNRAFFVTCGNISDLAALGGSVVKTVLPKQGVQVQSLVGE